MSNYVLYDYLQVSGGAERLSIDLVEGLPNTTLVVSRIYAAAEALQPQKILGDKLRCIGSLSSLLTFRIIDSLAAFLLNTRFLENANSVIYSGTYSPLAVINQKRGHRCYYCHTPPRYMFDWRPRYIERIPVIFRPIVSMMIDLIKDRYVNSLNQMDVIVANSQNVSNRLNKYLGIDARVIYPPIDTNHFHWIESGDYFVSLARLQPQKRVDRIIEAFLDLPDQKLVVASGGSDETRLKEMVGDAPNIRFAGWQTDAQLSQLIGGARAALYVAEDEDFGMSPVEAMASGKPVIGVREGGLVETILDGETGVMLSSNFTKDELINSIMSMTSQKAVAMRVACEERAQFFSKEQFIRSMREVAFI